MIVHNGALSSYALPYHQLKAVNVLGTLEVLRLAFLRRLKPLHFVSSLAVFPGAQGAPTFTEAALTDAEVDQKIATLATDFRMKPEQLRAQIEKNERMGLLRSQIRDEKTLRFLLDEAKR